MRKNTFLLLAAVTVLCFTCSFANAAGKDPVMMPKVGDMVSFGHYEQDNNESNDKETIEWIVLETATGYQKHDLKPGQAPEADFAVTEPVIAAYEYCNMHGLWKAEA